MCGEVQIQLSLHHGTGSHHGPLALHIHVVCALSLRPDIDRALVDLVVRVVEVVEHAIPVIEHALLCPEGCALPEPEVLVVLCRHT